MSGIHQILLGGPFGPAAAGDPYWQYTTLLSGTGTTNGAQNNTFTDSSSNAFSITRNGNTTQGSFSPFSAPNGYWGNYFDGSGDYLTLADSADWAFGSGNFTIECWVYNTGTDGFIVSQTDNSTASGSSFVLYITSGALNALVYYGGSSFISITDSASFPKNQWAHIALVRNSTTATLYVNGLSVGTGSLSTNSVNDVGSSLAIGARTNGNNPLTGYISNLRIVKGSAVYTAAFTPPTTPLTAISNTVLLTCQGNRFYDANTQVAAKTITVNGNPAVVPFANFGNTTAYSASSVGGSGYFDGTGDYLTVANSSSFAFGTGDFTVEFWLYANSASSTHGLVAASSTGSGYWASLIASNELYWQNANGSSNLFNVTYTQYYNQWTHVAFVRSSGTMKLYLNGVEKASASGDTTNYSGTAGNIDIGRDNDNSALLTGYMSGLRIVKGTAVYTAAFTPPTSPVTAITNTSLLCNFTNAGIYDQAAKNDMETVGNAQVSTSVKKYGDGSIAFDGTGDFMVMPYSQMFNFGTGDFTLECWAKITYVQYTAIISSTSTSISTGHWLLGFSNTANQMSFAIDSGGSAIVGADFANYLDTWTHIAVTRTGGVLKLFFNGNQVASVANTTNFTGDTANPVVMGRRYTNSTDYQLNGNVSDLRITKGFARYTYNFTPPTQKFANFYSAPVTPTADPYFDYTTLLLPGSGTNGAQNNTFLDSSTNAFSITRNGNTTQGTFSPFSQTGWSVFTGSSGSNELQIANSTNLQMGSGDFTAEGWFYPQASGSIRCFYTKGVNTTGGLILGCSTSEIFVRHTGQTDLVYTGTLSGWNHIAWVRSGSTLRIYLNGTSVASATVSFNQNDTSTVYIGAPSSIASDSNKYYGYASNFRLVKGTAVYTANFTPPTAALTAITNTQLLVLQSNRFVDNSANAFALTVSGSPSVQAFSPFAPTAAYSAATNGGSGYFDGSGDYLATSSTQIIPTGDFTIEAFIYFTGSFSSYPCIVSQGTTGNAGRLQFYLDTTGKLGFGIGSTVATSTGTVTANAWNHVAVTRSGSTVTFYINGSSSGTATNSGTPQNTALYIGNEWSNAYFTGYIANVRISTNVRTISSVPTSPYTNDANTALLANFTNAGITDATAKNDLETVGNAQISNTTAKFGSTSMYFDGTGDYLVTSPSEVNNLSAGDWTVEFWCYPTSASSSKTLINAATSASDPNGTHIWMNTSRQLVVDNTATGQSAFSGGTLTLNTWNHVAIVRYGGTTTGYINGSSVGSNTYTPNTNKVIAVGYLIANAGYDFAGYIQDLRVTKGIARYTQNFTPPTAAFQLL